MDTQENRIQKSGRFDPDFCRKVCRAAAIVSLSLTLSAVIVFVVVSPSKCPNWIIPNRDGTSFLVWPFISITGLWALVVSYHAITWNRFAQRVIDRIEWGERTLPTGRDRFQAMCATLIDFDKLFVAVMLGSVLFAAMPLLIMALHCS